MVTYLRLKLMAAAWALLVGLVWAATGCTAPPDSEPSTAVESEEVTLFVAPERQDCMGAAPQECLLIREADQENYALFYSSIEGFEFEPGYIYQLRVRKTPRENPSADGSALRWILIEIVEQTPASGDFEP